MTFLSFTQFDENETNIKVSRENAILISQELSRETTRTIQILFVFICISFNCYIILISLFKYYDAFYFNNYNVTKFLERFDEQCHEYYVNTKNKFKKLLKYCKKLIDNFVKTLIF